MNELDYELSKDEVLNFVRNDLDVKNLIVYKCIIRNNIFYLIVGKKLVY